MVPVLYILITIKIQNQYKNCSAPSSESLSLSGSASSLFDEGWGAERWARRLNKKEKVKQTCWEMPLTFSFMTTAGEGSQRESICNTCSGLCLNAHSVVLIRWNQVKVPAQHRRSNLGSSFLLTFQYTAQETTQLNDLNVIRMVENFLISNRNIH